MARSQGRYSRYVAMLKLALPLVALALLSTIFLFARDTDPAANLPVQTRADLAGRASEMVTDPSYSGITDSGAMLTLSARSARPDPEAEGRVRAEGLDAAMSFDDGSRIDLSAPDARLDDGEDRIDLQGGVTIRSSQGYTLSTDALSSAMSRIFAESEGPVEGTGPAGTLRAGRMTIEEQGAEGEVRMLFTDGVEMVYEP
ncbi:LPS export ABC transporter periplasmic protein LptC [Roseivivax halodurans]|uniref:LPS export ABC transporter periplasmic protein LptC n=1 Tax=Roseivivax halodurans TaxID=93683 RepID=UPI0004B30F3F|nr:LPS export ABC transporter periplasmic protein LptC [Roseivivax halodurans]